jgi:ProP effector
MSDIEQTTTPPPSSVSSAAAEPLGPNPATDVLKLLGQRFAVFREAKPLAIGIHKALMKLMPELDAAKVRTAMRRHTGSTRYLKAVATGDDRYGLEGQVDGKITAEQKQQAADALRERFKKGADRRREEVKAKQEQERAAALEKERQEKLQQLAKKFAKH